MKIHVIINPVSAGGRTGRDWPATQARLEGLLGPLEAHFTERAGEAVGLTAAALAAGAGTIIALGGDGTFSEVLNGFMDPATELPRNPDAVMGLISSGTGADYVRSLAGVGDRQAQIAAIARGEVKPVDVGVIELQGPDGLPRKRFFLNACSLGLSAAIANRVNLDRAGKAASGRFSYLISAFRVLIKQRASPIEVAFDGGPAETRKLVMLALMNGKYAGGGLQLGPMAALDSGRLEAIEIGDVGPLDLMLNAHRLFRGTHLSHPAISHRPARLLEARSATEVAIRMEADGELIGRLPARIRVLPGILPLIS